MSEWAEELEERAREQLPDPVHRYIRQGADASVSTAEAVEAWRRVRLVPRVLRDLSVVDPATTVLGRRMAVPLAVAPTTLQRLAHPRGEVAMAEGVAAAESPTLLCVSSNAGSRFADIATALERHALAGSAAAPGAAEAPGWWLQLYVQSDRSVSDEVLDLAVGAGATAVVLTVDTPAVGSKREGATSVWELVSDDHLHANERTPGRHRQVEKAADLVPADVERLAARSGLPVVVKGVLHPEDAVVAADAGAAAVWVSNHGGRQLDRAVTTASALPAVVSALDAHRGRWAGVRTEVYVDGGIRSGLDALVALGLGADLVFVGRTPLWALAVDGPAGVTRLLDGLAAELTEAMRLVGAVDVDTLRHDARSWQGR